MKKNLLALLLSFALLAGLCLPAHAANQHIFEYDAAPYLTGEEIATLETDAQRIETTYGCFPMILLVDDLGNFDDISALTRATLTEEAVGLDGVALGMDTEDGRYITLASDGKAADVFTESVLEAFDVVFSQSETYAQVCNSFLAFVDTVLSANWEIPAIPATTQAVPLLDAPEILLSDDIDVPLTGAANGVLSHMAGRSALPLLVDDAGLLSAAEAADLLQTLQTYSSELDCDLAIITTDSLEDYDAKDYADLLYDTFDFGRGETKDGVLFLLSMADRDWAVSSEGVGKKVFGDQSQSERLVNRASAALSANDFSAALPALADGMYQGVHRALHPYVSPVWLLVALAIAFLIAYLILKGMAASLKSVRVQTDAREYIAADSLTLVNSTDEFLYANKDRSMIARSTSSGGGARGSSSSGHGGGSGKF